MAHDTSDPHLLIDDLGARRSPVDSKNSAIDDTRRMTIGAQPAPKSNIGSEIAVSPESQILLGALMRPRTARQRLSSERERS